MHRAVWTLARAMAVTGGFVLLTLVLLTCLSISGRLLNGILNGIGQSVAPGFADWALDLGVGPVLGHVELVEAGIVFAIFAFLPLCQLSGTHAKVSIVTDRFPIAVQRWLIAGIDVVFAAVLILIAWRLFVGLEEKRAFSETSFLLQFPIWWAYAAGLAAAGAAAFTGVFVAGGRLVEAVTGREVLMPDGERSIERS
ncbi:MAG: TRAP transporter small permease subunit [Pseudomonadota bacterium]